MVLFPAPLGPTMAKISPSPTVNDTPSTALMPPKEMEMLLGFEQARLAGATSAWATVACAGFDEGHRTRSVFRYDRWRLNVARR